MSLLESVKNIITNQKKLMTAMEKEIETLEASDLVHENENLKQKLLQIQDQLQKETESKKQVVTENSVLKNSLYEQIYNEKLHLIQAAKKRSDLYFASKSQTELNRLQAFEQKAKNAINSMSKALKESRISAEDSVYAEIDELRKKIDFLVTTAESDYASKTGAFSTRQKEELKALEEEKIRESEFKNILQKNNLESLIGLNILSKIGILFLLIAVIALARYGYVLLTPLLKGIVIFMIGGLLLGLGEWLNRKSTTIFSIALTSGGIAILYTATSLSYFTLHILSIEVALLLCVINTILAFVLSLRYKAQTITLFALIGGYLPIVTITDPTMPVWILMIYFVFLNLFLLVISVYRKWIVSTITGFLLNIASSIYVMHMVLSVRDSSISFRVQDVWLLLYILFVFVLYSLIPIVATYKRKLSFTLPDILLIGMNTVVSAVLLNIAFYAVHLRSFMGTLAVLFAVVYLLLGWWMEKNMQEEKRVIPLFYLTGFAFVLLFIPFQFEKMWFSLGWLIEGVLLTVYGILKEDKGIKWGGIIASLLSLFTFLFFDVTSQVFRGYTTLFTFKYLAITASSIAILTALTVKRALQNTLARILKYATVLNSWFFILYISQSEWTPYVLRIFDNTPYSGLYMGRATTIVLTFLLSYGLKQIKILADDWMKLIQAFLYFVGIVWLFNLNMFQGPVIFTNDIASTGQVVIGTVLLILLGLLSVLALRELIRAVVVEKYVGVRYYPLIISGYAVIIITQNLITQYGFGFQSLVISLVYLVTALLWIIFGFLKRNSIIRKFGLGLSIMATAKLVFIDLSGLTSFTRMISYFAFGIFLLGISLVYQHFNKRLQLQTKETKNEK